jgi:hypothetical protein
MKQPSTSRASPNSIQVFAPLAIVGAAAFLGILLLLHFLEPEFDPTWRMISEYEIGHYGWLMTLAFFCWGSSVLGLVVALRSLLQTPAGNMGRWWFLLLGIVLFGAGIFTTNAITDPTPRLSNTLHTLCGALVILTFPIAATLVAGSLARNQTWRTVSRGLTWETRLVWLSLVLFFASIVVSRAINPNAGRVGPEVFLGLPNRLMVVMYNIWLMVVARRALRLTGQKGG